MSRKFPVGPSRSHSLSQTCTTSARTKAPSPLHSWLSHSQTSIPDQSNPRFSISVSAVWILQIIQSWCNNKVKAQAAVSNRDPEQSKHWPFIPSQSKCVEVWNFPAESLSPALYQYLRTWLGHRAPCLWWCKVLAPVLGLLLYSGSLDSEFWILHLLLWLHTELHVLHILLKGWDNISALINLWVSRT